MPAPAAMDERKRRGRGATRQGQLALRADQGAAGDHLAPVADEPVLDLGSSDVLGRRGSIVARVAEIRLDETHEAIVGSKAPEPQRSWRRDPWATS